MRRAVKLYHVQELVEITGISRRTIRACREAGLLEPAGRQGRSPLFTEDAVDTLRRVQRLRADLGVNLAGAQVILEMREKILELQRNLEEVVQFITTDLRTELEQYLRREEKAVIPKPLTRPPKPLED